MIIRSETSNDIDRIRKLHISPKFGFVPSITYGIKSEYNVPENVFMILELSESTLKDCHGTVKYHEVFMEL